MVFGLSSPGTRRKRSSALPKPPKVNPAPPPTQQIYPIRTVDFEARFASVSALNCTI